MKFKEVTLKSESELQTLLLDLRKEVQELSVKLRLNQVKNPQKLRQAKKDIARILTYLHQSKNK